MSTDTFRFPSGVTPQQAKKDARRLARKTGHPHQQCLDEIAVKQGFSSWAKAMSQLESATAASAALQLGYFDLPLAGGVVQRVQLDPERPIVVISGFQGCGKTVMALELARQALDQGAPVQYEGLHIPPGGDTKPWEDPVLLLSAPLSQNPNFYSTVISPTRLRIGGWRLADVSLPRRGGLLIHDEADFLQGLPDNAKAVAEWARQHGVFVVLSFQEPVRQGGFWESLDAPIGLRIEGMAPSFLPSKIPEREALLARARTLGFKPGEYAEFAVAEHGQPWPDIVRLPCPAVLATP